MAFRGSFDHTLDAKNRLTIPSRFRAAFADGIVLSRRHDAGQCVAVWRRDEFDRFSEAMLEGLHPMSDAYEAINRFYTSYSHDAELDAAGRVMVPANMLEQTGLGKDVVVNGAGNRLEIWSRASWSEESAKLISTIQRFTEQLGNPA